MCILLGLGALLVGVSSIATQWEQPLRTTVNIDLSPGSLPKYMLFFLRPRLDRLRVLAAIHPVGCHLGLLRRAGAALLLPALDVLQSIPVLGFLPGLVLFLVGLFPHSNTGLELACVLTIFTGQVWNMTFSYYDSLRAVPANSDRWAKYTALIGGTVSGASNCPAARKASSTTAWCRWPAAGFS